MLAFVPMSGDSCAPTAFSMGSLRLLMACCNHSAGQWMCLTVPAPRLLAIPLAAELSVTSRASASYPISIIRLWSPTNGKQSSLRRKTPTLLRRSKGSSGWCWLLPVDAGLPLSGQLVLLRVTGHPAQLASDSPFTTVHIGCLRKRHTTRGAPSRNLAACFNASIA